MKGLIPYSTIQDNQIKLDVPKIQNDVSNKAK